MNAPPLRVLIAEDNEDLRDLLVTLVSAESDLRCVGTANTVDDVIACEPPRRVGRIRIAPDAVAAVPRSNLVGAGTAKAGLGAIVSSGVIKTAV